MTGGEHTQHCDAVMRRLLCALLLAGLAAGCERAGTVRLDAPEVELRVRNYRYDRQDVSVPSGRVTFTIVNEGPEPTNFRVRRGRRDLLSIATLAPGERGTASARLRPGEYVMYSSVGRHEVLGEHGTLTVRRG
jgi:hypothetical protein